MLELLVSVSVQPRSSTDILTAEQMDGFGRAQERKRLESKCLRQPRSPLGAIVRRLKPAFPRYFFLKSIGDNMMKVSPF